MFFSLKNVLARIHNKLVIIIIYNSHELNSFVQQIMFDSYLSDCLS